MKNVIVLVKNDLLWYPSNKKLIQIYEVIKNSTEMINETQKIDSIFPKIA